MNARQPQYGEVASETEDLKSLCDVDIEEMISVLEDTEKNWDDVSKLLGERLDDVQHMESRLMEFDMKEKYCNEAIGEVRRSLEAEPITGVNSGKLRLIKEGLEKTKKKIDDLEPGVIAVESLSDQLESRHANSDVAPVKSRAEETRKEYDRLKVDTSEKGNDVEAAVKELEDVENRAAVMADKLEELAKKMTENRPKKMVVEELALQAENAKVCSKILEVTQMHLFLTYFC